jgi:hypothetical protein
MADRDAARKAIALDAMMDFFMISGPLFLDCQ